uniref:Secreted protein n=1 Tax=Heterorhabditis bacteriophora TaxID=37862 RepID=A0A1I7XF66_HETBA
MQCGCVATGSDCSGEQASAIWCSLIHNFFRSGNSANLRKERASTQNFRCSTYQTISTLKEVMDERAPNSTRLLSRAIRAHRHATTL